MTQTINLLASARPNLGAARQSRCTLAAGGGAEVPLRAGRGDDAQDGRAAEPRRLGITARRRRMGRRPMMADRRRGGRRGRRRISGGRRQRRIPWGRGQGAPRKAVVGEDDGGGGGGGHDGNDGGGSRTKKWLSAGGGGLLLLYIDTPLVPGRVTNRDKRGAVCHSW
jgi:hypothetical protein